MSDDAISRQAAIDVVSGIDRHFVKYIKEWSPVTPKERTGHWIKHKNFGKWECSCCGVQFRFPFKEHYFCPNCGAKMEE